MVDKVILITGALAGIGRATALAAAREGYKVIVSGRNSQIGAALEDDLRGLGAEAQFVKADVRKESDVRGLVETAISRSGRLDVAVNNAGTEGTPGPVVDQTPESYAATFDTNVLGVLLCMKYEFRIMESQGAGSIINVSSTMGSRGTANASLYVASKHAVEGLTKSGALEAASFGVRVNAVAPGPVETGMLDRFTGSQDRKAGLLASIPLRRAGKPEELADAILFLASEKASFVTGQIINVNGGRTAS
ncbi:SDR family NAD(P)-dependent oxidoreductase [Paraburkholderia strydomiana]|uniref:Glucose 1-dehydrogenase n=1 Tax=Paraburkholderia strydomiana TaxID=1245417 RepID=A0ABW9C1F9_9BURK